jgi:hypothetical protein
MVVHGYNLRTQEERQEDSEFETILGYIAHLCLKETKN